MTMRTQLRNMKRRVQRGFTLVELAIVLVIAGLILVAVLRGTDAIQKAQVERMVSDLRGMQGILLEFQKRNGRLPGDCDNNGILHNAAGSVIPLTATALPAYTSNAGNASILDFNQANRTMPEVPDAGTDSPLATCADNTAARENNINLVWNELRRAGVVDSHRLPRELARHSMGDVFLVSTMRDTAALGSQPAGIIVVYGIPVWMAEAVDAAIDGAATLYDGTGNTLGAASTGRVRLWAGGGTPNVTPMTIGTNTTNSPYTFTASQAANSYDGGVRDRDRLISISFQYTPNKLIR